MIKFKKKIKPCINKKDLYHYISESDIIKFVTINSNLNWNMACDYVRNIGLTSDDGEPISWEQNDVYSADTVEVQPEAIEWMKKFYEAHPFLDKIVFVLD